MTGILYLILGSLCGKELAEIFVGQKKTGKNNRIWLVLPGAFGVGMLAFGWVTYLIAWAASTAGAHKPLIYGNLLTMAAGAVVLFCIYILRYRKNKRIFTDKGLIKDKKLLLIDDSIVRGTQLRETTEFLYRSGAKEVHVRPACPPIMYGCKYLNFSRSKSEMELIARQVIEKREGPNCPQEVLDEYADPHTEKYEQMVQDICEMQNFTTLRYHRLDDLLESIGIDPCNVCTYCFNGKE